MLAPGTIIGNYRIEKELNIGEFADSFLAFDTRDNKQVFFKEYKNPTSHMPEFGRFVDQQRYVSSVVSTLDIAETIYETFEENCRHYQAKQFMVGQPLDRLLESSPTNQQRLLVSALLLYAMRRVHGAGLVHGDLKPQQIYLQDNPAIEMKYEIRVADFDFCWIPGKFKPVFFVCTPFWQSPEHFSGGPIDKPSDVFTLGLMLYQILRGVNPVLQLVSKHFEGKVADPEQVDDAIRVLITKTGVPPISAFATPGALPLPPALEAMVSRMVSPKAETRPTLAEVSGHFLDYIGTFEAASTAPKPAPVPAAPAVPVPSKPAAPAAAPSPVAMPAPAPAPAVPVRVHFHAAHGSFYFAVHKSQVFGRTECKATTDPAYQFVAKEQFLVEKRADGWYVGPCASVLNPTYVNGTLLEGGAVRLEDGSEIFVGNLTSGNGMKLRVQLVN